MDFNVILMTLNKIELIEKCYLNDIEWNFPRPCWLLPVADPADYRENIIKLNILMIEYTKQMCYNAITSKSIRFLP